VPIDDARKRGKKATTPLRDRPREAIKTVIFKRKEERTGKDNRLSLNVERKKEKRMAAPKKPGF